MLQQRFWQRALIESLLVLFIAATIGLITGYLLLAIAIALALLLIWHLYHIQRLSSWLWHQNSLYPPHSLGSFEVIFYGLHKHQKRARLRQNELAEIIKRFRYASQSIPDTLLMTDSNGKIEWCNKMAQYQLNIRWPNDKGQNIINLIRHPEFATYMRLKDFSAPFTLLFHNKNYIEFRVIPYIDNQWIIIARDVDQLYLAEKQRHDFFTNASHELRTPLTVVKGYLSLFNDEMIPPQKQKMTLITMLAQIERMESLISQILSLSQIENTTIKNQLQPVNMPAILYKINDDLNHLYPKYPTIFDIDRKLRIIGHKQQLESVVNNLIFNAIKHTPEQSQITVQWKRRPQGAYFSVTDSGPGISVHHINRLTERFYQVDSARSQQNNCSGLGLAIVKHALQNHSNTKLEIKSEIGKGSCFSFTLPSQYIDQKDSLDNI